MVASGRIITLDSRARVTATGVNGATLWQADLTPAADRADDASGGGLAAADGKVFVTTELGGGGTARAETVRIAKRGVRNVLIHAGIVEGEIDARPTRWLDMPSDDCFAFAEEDAGEEFVAEELRSALSSLDRLTGRAGTENLLEELFSSFCVGK